MDGRETLLTRVRILHNAGEVHCVVLCTAAHVSTCIITLCHVFLLGIRRDVLANEMLEYGSGKDIDYFVACEDIPFPLLSGLHGIYNRIGLAW